MREKGIEESGVKTLKPLVSMETYLMVDIVRRICSERSIIA